MRISIKNVIRADIKTFLDISIFIIFFLLMSYKFLLYPFQVVQHDIFPIQNATDHLIAFFKRYKNVTFPHSYIFTIYDLYIAVLEKIFSPLVISKIFMISVIVIPFFIMYIAIRKKYNKSLLLPSLIFAINTVTIWFTHGGDGWIILAMIYAFFPVYWLIFSKDKISKKDFVLAIIPILLSASPWMYYMTLIYFVVYRTLINKLKREDIRFITYLFAFSTIFYATTSQYMIGRLLNPEKINPYSISSDFIWGYSANPIYILLLSFNKSNGFVLSRILEAHYIPWMIIGFILIVISTYWTFLSKNKEVRALGFLNVSLLSIIALVSILSYTNILPQIPSLVKILSIIRAPTKLMYFIYFNISVIIADLIYSIKKNPTIIQIDTVSSLVYLLVWIPLVGNGFFGYHPYDIALYTYDMNIYPRLQGTILYLPYTIELQNIVETLYPDNIGIFVNGPMVGYSEQDIKRVEKLYNDIVFCSSDISSELRSLGVDYIIIDDRFVSPIFDTFIAMNAPFIYGNSTNFLKCLGKYYTFYKNGWFYIADLR